MGILKYIPQTKFQYFFKKQNNKKDPKQKTKQKPAHTQTQPNKNNQPTKTSNAQHTITRTPHTKSESFRMERTAGKRSLEEQMDRVLLKVRREMQKNMTRFIHLLACGCAERQKIHLHWLTRTSRSLVHFHNYDRKRKQVQMSQSRKWLQKNT